MAKSMAEHRLDGTIKSYHKEKIKTENFFSQFVLEGVSALEPPSSLTDNFVKTQYIAHSKTLLKFKLLNPMDLGSFNLMYETLQEVRDIYKKMQACDKSEDLEVYSQYVSLHTKLSNQYINLSRQFFVTPAVRQKMTLNELEIEQKKNETAISKLLKK